MFNIVILIGICLLGILAGYLLGMIKYEKKPVGTLRVDQSDPDDSPYLFLELDDSAIINKVTKMKEVTFRVNTENYIS